MMRPKLTLILMSAWCCCGATQLPVGLAQVNTSSSYLQKSRDFHTIGEFERLTSGRVRLFRKPSCELSGGDTLFGSSNGIVLRRAGGVSGPYPPGRMLPASEVTVLAEERAGVLWIGTKRGAVRSADDGIQYLAGKRWLPDDRVSGIGFDPETHDVWIESAEGMSCIHFRSMTLAGKAAAFEERIRLRHLRHGFTAVSRLTIPGDLNSSRPVSTDNDGLWTAIYLAAECFRFKVTGETEARENARRGMQALMRLESVTGIPGFPARSLIRTATEETPKDGEWHATPDGIWEWKGDTSSDEIVGHYFAYSVYFDLVADNAEKRQIQAVVNRITSHILDHGYRLIDLDGKPTTWGWWGPEDIWKDPDETGLRALHLLSHLCVAYHITGNERYRAAYYELVKRHHYALLTRNQKVNIPGHVNHSDDELAFLSFYPLLRLESDRDLRNIYVESLERSWQCERAERNPLWNFIYAAGTGSEDSDLQESIRALREIPMDMISWTVVNFGRLDVIVDPLTDRFRKKQSLVVLPADERPLMKWNGNPYALDGGDGGRSEDDGAFFLLPYWLGRYHRFIE